MRVRVAPNVSLARAVDRPLETSTFCAGFQTASHFSTTKCSLLLQTEYHGLSVCLSRSRAMQKRRVRAYVYCTYTYVIFSDNVRTSYAYFILEGDVGSFLAKRLNRSRCRSGYGLG